VSFWSHETVKVRKRWRFTFTDERKQNPVTLFYRVIALPDFIAKCAANRLARGRETFAIDVEQPAVKCASQTTRLQTSRCQVCASMWAITIKHSVSARLITKYNEILAHKAHSSHGALDG
jgi:hypothetical protein